MRPLRTFALSSALALLAACGGDPGATGSAAQPASEAIAGPSAAGAENGERAVTVLSRNLYLGADIGRLLAPMPAEQLPLAVYAFWQTVAASDIPARAAAVAAEIAALRPDLVGLQEASLWRVGPPDQFTGAPTPATTVQWDFVELVLDELAALGFHYDVVSTSTGFDAELTAVSELPPTATTVAFDARMTDRDVVLARAGLTVLEEEDGLYVARVPITVAGFELEIPRGWNSVVAKDQGATFRFVNTHLEVGGPFGAIQQLQAGELVELLGESDLPTILVGDLNSPADGSGTTSYAQVVAAGLTDAWSALSDEPGYTCCQDEDLRNATSSLDERIDLVLFRGPFVPRWVELVGEAPEDRIDGVLWPSDHAGVAASLRPVRGGAAFTRAD